MSPPSELFFGWPSSGRYVPIFYEVCPRFCLIVSSRAIDPHLLRGMHPVFFGVSSQGVLPCFLQGSCPRLLRGICLHLLRGNHPRRLQGNLAGWVPVLCGVIDLVIFMVSLQGESPSFVGVIEPVIFRVILRGKSPSFAGWSTLSFYWWVGTKVWAYTRNILASYWTVPFWVRAHNILKYIFDIDVIPLNYFRMLKV